MAKTYLDILSERGIRPFLTDEAFEELQKFDYKSQYAIPGQVIPVFKHPNQHKIELGKTTNLIGDMCWYGASVEELVRSIKYGMVVLDADKRHLDWKKAAEDFGIQELLKEYRRFRCKPKLTEREKLVITAYTGYVLEGTAGKVVDFVEQELGHSIQTPEPPAVPVVVEVRRALQEELCEICRKHHIFDYI